MYIYIYVHKYKQYIYTHTHTYIDTLYVYTIHTPLVFRGQQICSHRRL